MSGAPQTRIAPPFHFRRDTSTAPSTGSNLQARGEGARVQPPAAGGRRPRTQPSPCGEDPAAGFPPASLFHILARSRERPRGSRARRGRDRRLEQPHQRCVLETACDRQGVTERDAHALERCLDHHRVQTTARHPGQVRRAGLLGGKSITPYTECSCA